MARAPAAVDTIAAIATPPGRGGVGIVRVSGGGVAGIAAGVLGRVPPPRVATFATFRGARGEPLDCGIALSFPAPASFTGEDVLELHGHASPVGLGLLLARCLELGARLAQPGEFTRRAFLNGKLDLAQAESVADYIEAATATAARAAVRSLSGEFSREVRALVEGVTQLRMFTEATLDFPDEDIEFLRASDAAGKLRALRAALAALLAKAATGVRLAQGLAVVLVGRPNVGKSSLLNRLVREDAAIVTAIPGTTRDTVERPAAIGGIPLTVIDTAGLRDTADEVERLGIERTRAAIARADLALLLVDARESADALHPDDAAVLASLPAGLPRLVVHNKADLAAAAPRVERREARTHVWLSALTGAGLDLLEREVLAIAGVASVPEDAFIARERHLAALREAAARLDEAGAQFASPAPALELFAESLREAQDALSAITGEFTADDLLGAIFARFCIGK
ncbi:MAG: tRNA uridine-5-carboxymethylaminomethyl(34) synthesis GTPase MnmE [Betaproteobacteria bacterium]|nr:tRNA uridine-5-carboxymethylaminomethyl(34) synthesis GTPase MnmE [Betaproteobacteria bacterium]MDH5287515.1 tRNA uridine-5-carboxymethylaminomethyl(34) synthesis GTPase MnmE [Betaproteobacteria bacterium]